MIDDSSARTAIGLDANGLVDGETLLKIGFPVEKCRPCLATLERRARAREIPSVRIGRLRYYSPAAVMAAWMETSPKRGGGR